LFVCSLLPIGAYFKPYFYELTLPYVDKYVQCKCAI